MINREKVIIMSKLAILDKQNIQKDLKITHYYPEDYVYINNLMTRLSIFVIIGIGILGHILLQMEQRIIIPTTGKELLIHYIVPYGGFTLVILVIYSIISTHVYTKRYKKAQERVNAYRKLMTELEELEKVEGERRRDDGKRKTLNPAG